MFSFEIKVKFVNQITIASLSRKPLLLVNSALRKDGQHLVYLSYNNVKLLIRQNSKVTQYSQQWLEGSNSHVLARFKIRIARLIFSWLSVSQEYKPQAVR